MRRTALVLGWALLFAGTAPGCWYQWETDELHEGPEVSESQCGQPAPLCGVATLNARSHYDDYEAATLSIEHARVDGTDCVRNDWDLQFGNDGWSDADLFSVNMVVDDRSFIVDLGPIPFAEVPATVDPEDYPTGAWGEHDDIPAVVGHTYLVRTRDSDTCQYAAFRVTEHVANQSVTVEWVRSVMPDRFAMFE